MNIFSVLSMGKSRLHETSMSAMLAYLLNPNQDHGLGHKFLSSFFELVNKKEIYNSRKMRIYKRIKSNGDWESINDFRCRKS